LGVGKGFVFDFSLGNKLGKAKQAKDNADCPGSGGFGHWLNLVGPLKGLSIY